MANDKTELTEYATDFELIMVLKALKENKKELNFIVDTTQEETVDSANILKKVLDNFIDYWGFEIELKSYIPIEKNDYTPSSKKVEEILKESRKAQYKYEKELQEKGSSFNKIPEGAKEYLDICINNHPVFIKKFDESIDIVEVIKNFNSSYGSFFSEVRYKADFDRETLVNRYNIIIVLKLKDIKLIDEKLRRYIQKHKNEEFQDYNIPLESYWNSLCKYLADQEKKQTLNKIPLTKEKFSYYLKKWAGISEEIIKKCARFLEFIAILFLSNNLIINEIRILGKTTQDGIFIFNTFDWKIKFTPTDKYKKKLDEFKQDKISMYVGQKEHECDRIICYNALSQFIYLEIKDNYVKIEFPDDEWKSFFKLLKKPGHLIPYSEFVDRASDINVQAVNKDAHQVKSRIIKRFNRKEISKKQRESLIKHKNKCYYLNVPETEVKEI